MTTFVQHIDDDTNYKLLGLVKDIKKELKSQNILTNMSKTQCIEDIITIVINKTDKDKLISDIIEIRKAKGLQNRK